MCGAVPLSLVAALGWWWLGVRFCGHYLGFFVGCCGSRGIWASKSSFEFLRCSRAPKRLKKIQARGACGPATPRVCWAAMDELDVAASVLETADDDDFEDEVMVEVNPGDPGPPDAATTSEELSKLHEVNSADSPERQKVGAELCTVSICLKPMRVPAFSVALDPACLQHLHSTRTRRVTQLVTRNSLVSGL